MTAVIDGMVAHVFLPGDVFGVTTFVYEHVMSKDASSPYHINFEARMSKAEVVKLDSKKLFNYLAT